MAIGTEGICNLRSGRGSVSWNNNEFSMQYTVIKIATGKLSTRKGQLVDSYSRSIDQKGKQKSTIWLG